MSAVNPDKPVLKNRLTPTCSVLLDVVRFTAALVVFYSHYGHPRLGLDVRKQSELGNLWVSVFFVLSGFVIRFVTVSRIGTLKAYFIDRASRIYSVVLPCLVLTFVIAGIGLAVNPDMYWMAAGHTHGRFMVPAQLFANLTFTSQLWGYELAPPSNGPFWSISFEVFYYALYGVVFYSVRGKWFWVLLLLLIAGPSIVLNAPYWLLGCLVYDLFARYQDARRAPVYTSAGVLVLVAMLVALRHRITWLIALTDRPRRMAWITRAVVAHVPHAHALLYQSQIPWLSRVSVSYVVSSLLTGAGMLWALIFLSRYLPTVSAPVAKWVRIVADSTFTLYLLHLPLLTLVTVCLNHPVKNRVAVVAIPVVIITLCVLLSRVFERLKLWMRKSMLHFGARSRPAVVVGKGEAG